MVDVLSKTITPEVGAAKIKKLETAKPDFTAVTAKVAENKESN